MEVDKRVMERDSEIYAMIDRYDMERRTGLTREQLHQRVLRGMVSNNFAFVFADAANTFLLDCEAELARLGVAFGHKDKYNFRQMLDHIKAARKWAEKSAQPIYEIGKDTDNACYDSDWWYHMAKLIDDRLGDDRQKTHMFLEWVLSMPREVGVYDVKYGDFKRNMASNT